MRYDTMMKIPFHSKMMEAQFDNDSNDDNDRINDYMYMVIT